MLKVAQSAAYASGKILLENYGKITETEIREKRENDFLTYVDELSEKNIIDTIHRDYPGHAILAEESGTQEQAGSYRWIIDPLDGTRNFISGIPVFAISIGLQYEKEIVLGVVYDPVRDEMFHAESSQGAYLNGKRIRVNEQNDLSRSLLATGFPFRYKTHLRQYMDCFKDIFKHTSGIRRLGAASIDLAYVAAGKFEGFWELGLSPWDMAAGSLIIQEAGGQISDFWGNPLFLDRGYIVATNGKIHRQLLDIIQEHFSDYVPLED
jgi:myo-inositol-1(or 4)-monophosphatase